MALILKYAVRSDLGLVRGNNEDSVYAGPRLLAVADGMGGHAAGEVASKIVIGTLESLDEDRSLGDLMAALREAVLDANQRIADAVEKNPDLDGMGTTLTALRFVGNRVGLVHVGDSRGYLLRGGLLTQITHDDTYVQYLVDTGKITAEEAKDHPRKSVILRAMRGADVDPDVSIREVREGDRYLLCSDGLSDVVSAETIAETLNLPDPQECADRLVELTLRGGAPDNVTVIVADVVQARVGELVNDVPVIAGAFVDPSAADVPGTDTPAERAAAISRPRLPTRSAPDEPKRRRRWRTPLLIVAVLVVIAAALTGVYAWTQTYYFVGRDGSEVAIFHGVNTAFGPLKFYEVDENTGLKLNELEQSSRSQVKNGITAHNKKDARQIVDRLRSDHLLPLCQTLTSSAPATSSSSTPTSTPTSGTTRTSSHSTARSAATHSAATHSTATHSTASSTPTTSAPPTGSVTHNPVPGVDCRTTP
ncbi:MAG TPA: PP2C family serine/threonine-protein phosphatase [Jatrophihabitantaceae bacterium]|nr:PP2C family serine/threonine-protein phosphatase [Jatrophihabitantaceae bacterium]